MATKQVVGLVVVAEINKAIKRRNTRSCSSIRRDSSAGSRKVALGDGELPSYDNSSARLPEKQLV